MTASRFFSSFLSFVAVAWVLAGSPAAAQIVPPVTGATPGVYVEPDGTVKRRQIDVKDELALMRARAAAAAAAAKDPQLAFVSLPKTFATAKEAVEAGKPIPDEVRFLSGLTRIDYVFVDPQQKDLLIAGPAEPVKQGKDLQAVGGRTGRPVLHLEDLVVAMRVVSEGRGRAFGCRLDPDPQAPARITEVMRQYARASRAARIEAVRKVTGPQKVSFFGRVPPDTRFALVTIAADYELKRYALGLARHTVPNLGTIVDATRQAVNMIWFELDYQPLLVSADGNSFGLKGQRLKVQAGSFDWDAKGATPRAFAFAKDMTKCLPILADTQPLIADLQNLADLSVVAALIRRDKLDERTSWDTAWFMSETAKPAFPIERVTIPKQADALANYSNGAIASGGVTMAPFKMLEQPAVKDSKLSLASVRQSQKK